ncbi:MAG: hypothetical protein K9M57_09035 [Phycisphaerae bacterium]|nr:hypothetical protein [Phycisphaerae bacterium]
MLSRVLPFFFLFFSLTGTVLGAGSSWTSADFNRDGGIDLLDYSILTAAWQEQLPWTQEPQRRVYGHWRFDEGAGSVAGDAIRGNHGTLVGQVSWQEGKLGTALQFSKQGHVDVTNAFNQHAITQSITLAAWIKFSKKGNWPTIVSKGDNSWKLCLRGNTGMLHFALTGITVAGDEITGENDFINGTIDLSDDQWHHVAGVYDHQAGRMTIYVDGAIDVQKDATGTIAANNHGVWVGGNSEYSGTNRGGWDGLIDNVRVYDYPLTPAELNQTEYFVNKNGGSNSNDGLSENSAFATIQHGIDSASQGDCVYLCPGRYAEPVFIDKAITLASVADAAILEAPGDFAITLSGVQSDCVICNLVITHSDIGLFLVSSSPVIRHLTVTANLSGLEAYAGSYPVVEHCVFWENDADLTYEMPMAAEARFSCVQSGATGEGNIRNDPLFADPNSGDFHLRSDVGRYKPGASDPWDTDSWVTDSQASPCIDVGDPNIYPWRENAAFCGGYINMGSHGATPYASLSAWALAGDSNYDGCVDICDLVILSRHWLTRTANE